MTLNIIVYCCWEKHRAPGGLLQPWEPGKLHYESRKLEPPRTVQGISPKVFTHNSRGIGFVGHSQVPKPSLSKWGLVHNFSCGNEFYCMRIRKHFHISGWVLNLVLILRPGGTRKWHIVEQFSNRCFTGKRPQKMAPGPLANSPTQRYWHRDQVLQPLPYKKGNSGRRLDIRDTCT